MDKRLRILMLEDTPADAALMEHELRRAGVVFVSSCVATKETFERELDTFHPDIILSDYSLPSFDGLAALAIVKEKYPDIPFILVTGVVGEEFATETLKKGATDYVLKNNLSRLVPVINRALLEAQERSRLRETEKSLQESEKLYRLLADNTPDMITRHLPDSTYLYVSPACRTLFGYEPEELMGTKAFDQMHPEDAKRVIAITQEAVRTGQPNMGRYRHRKKDGQYIWVETTGKVVKNKITGDVEDIICVVRDITERKKTEDALEEEAIRRRILIDQSRDGIVVLDQDGRVYEANQRFADMLGYSAEEVRQLHVWDWDTQWTSEELLGKIRLVDAVGDHFETRHRRKDGTVYDVEISTNGAKWGDQKLVFCVCRDITSRKQNEETLRRQLSIINTYPGMVALSDMEGKLIYINSAGARMVGYKDPSEVIGVKSIPDFHSPGDLRTVMDVAIPSALEKGTWTGENRALKTDGSSIPVEQTIFLIRDESGQPQSLGTIMTDITERRRAEEDIRIKASLLETASDAILLIDQDAHFIYFNSALTRMTGYTREELLARNLHGIEPPEFAAKIKPNISMLMERGEAFFESAYLRKDSTIVPVEVHAVVIKVSGRRVIISAWRDISERKLAEKMLRESEQRYGDLFDNAHDMIQSVAPDGHFVFVNAAWLKTMGYTWDELGMLTIFDILHPCSKPHCTEAFQKVMSGESMNNLEAIFVTKDEREVDVEGNVSARRIDGKVVASHGIFRDITERKRAKEAMEKLATAVENATDWILVADREGNITYVNKTVEELSGYSKEELIGKNPRIFNSGKHNRQFYRELWDTILAGNSFHGMITNRKRNGELFELYHTITPLKDDNGNVTHFIATSKDITQQKLMEERINYLGYYDALTELPNRSLFTDRLTQTIARAEYEKRLIGVLVLNLDRFKLMNEAFGPAICDMVLKEIAKRLSNSVREGDTAARLGSDEFGIVLVDVAHTEDIILIAEKIIKSLSSTIKVDDKEILTTASIGVSIYPNDGDDPQSLMQNGYTALARAKEQGGNNYQFYTPGMNARASEFVSMERNLFNALKNDEYVLYYQPYFDLNTRKIIGMEALIRWKTGEGELVPPGQFIPILEETKMIIEVGEWILRTAMRQVKEWQNSGYPVVPVSVNLSLVQFKQRELAAIIKGIMGECGYYPSLLTLEITESAFMQDIELTDSVLKKLKDMGISISIDDFGTGYSSLSYLKRFPIDNLKIDMSFIREIVKDPDSASIVVAIINMAHALSLKTTAEGIETEEQWKFLRLLRCDMGQGFYFSKPLPAEEVKKLLA